MKSNLSEELNTSIKNFLSELAKTKKQLDRSIAEMDELRRLNREDQKYYAEAFKRING